MSSNTIFIILTVILVAIVAVYIIGSRKGAPQQTPKEIKESTPAPEDDDDEI